jgi:hypothetical protein
LTSSEKQAGIPETQQTCDPAAANKNEQIPHGENGNTTEGVTLTRSGRKAKPASRLIKTMVTKISTITTLAVEGELAFNEATSLHSSLDYDDPLLAYKAVSDPAILYYHEAMKEKDSQLFLDSMMREVEDQYNNGNFTVIHKSDVPDGHVILPAVWQMRR